MSKSSYEEALDIVNESLEQPDCSVIFKHTGLNELKKALEHAQQQEKLLGLYRKLITVKNEIISLLIRNEEYDEKEVIEIDLEKQIKELENE